MLEVLQSLNIFFLVLHVLSTVVAVGSVTVIDYLHLIGLRKKKIEKKLFSIYPFLSELLVYMLISIYITGLILVINKPTLLQSALFLTKLILVAIVTVNGFYLKNKVSPELEACVTKGTKACSTHVLNTSVISGSLSVVSWYSIFILSITKTTGYTVFGFVKYYLLALLIVTSTLYFFEKRSRHWRKKKFLG